MADPTEPTPTVTPAPAPVPAPPLSVAGKIRQAVLDAIAWEKANQRVVAAGMMYLSLHSTRLKPVIAFIAALLGLQIGCASSQYVLTATQLGCYAQANQDAEFAADKQCGGHLTGCAAGDAIVAKLKADLELCK